MSTLLLIGLIVVAVILVIGIIRVIIKPSHGFLGFFADLLLLDLLIDILVAVIEAMGDI